MSDNTQTSGKLKQAYLSLVSSNKIESDHAQLELVAKLDALLAQLSQDRLSSKSSALGWLFGKNKPASQPVKGLYVWGGVGRGKSMIMDMFFSLLPHKRKRRAHFNDFMQDAQERIHAHRKAFAAGEVKQEDPIPAVAEDLVQDSSVLCFDEFTVTDIADAMILGRLFEHLFEAGVAVVATSNVEPSNLYRDGLNRKIFLPFIDLLLEHVDVHELAARTDFRLEKLNRAPVYLYPLNVDNQRTFEDTWVEISGVETPRPLTLELKGRKLEIPMSGNGAGRVDFARLCEEPRSAEDFLALTRQFHTIFLEKIPVMGRENHNAAKRFILLIDTLYDNGVRLVATAEAAPDALYTAKSGTEAFEFARTISRLNEMQSVEYIAGEV
jgi:cell division protein ZapE